MLKVAHLCPTCQKEFATCDARNIVFGGNSPLIQAAIDSGECEKLYIDAAIACDGYKDAREE